VTDALSILDRPIVLAEVFDPDLFTELCRAYVDLYGVGIKVFDAAHDKLVDLTFAGGLNGYLFEIPEARRRLTQFITDLKSRDVVRGDWLVRNCEVTGARYMLAAVTHDQDVLGKVVVGPYLPEDAPDDWFPTGDWTGLADPERFAALRGEMRRLGDRTLRKVITGLLKAVDVVCHAGYKQVLTSQMHLESITAAYEELQRKNRELEEKNALLEETNERLREIDKLKSNFLATVSHELRTPLTSVIGYSEMLLEGLAGPLAQEQHDYVRTIMEKGESLLHLISGILDISKIEKGAQEIVRNPALPSDLVESALSFIRPQLAKKKQELTVDVEEGLPLLMVDTYKMRQVLINLLGNAVKFTPEEGHIGVRARRWRGEDTGVDWVRFEVIDDGIGIPNDKLEKIFETFFQVDNSPTREYGGTGLGLAIVKNFVESHGGRVTVQSELARGSIFAFTVPIEAEVMFLSSPTSGVR
jgi:signal transduction histidine kinase